MNKIQKPISIIVAIDLNGGIGIGNKLLCTISEDLKRFKELTLGKIVVMGRNTWESLPIKPLPGRINIVLSKTLQQQLSDHIVILPSIEKVFEFLSDKTENFIIGGQQIYDAFMVYATKLYVTEILTTFEADKFFPIIDYFQWKLIETSDVRFDKKNNVHYIYKTFLKESKY